MSSPPKSDLPPIESGVGSEDQPRGNAPATSSTSPVPGLGSQASGAHSQALTTDSGLGSQSQATRVRSKSPTRCDAPAESGFGTEAQGSEGRAPSSGGQGSSSSGIGPGASRRQKLTVSIPMRLISECTGRRVCVGTVDGAVYKGKLSAYDEVSIILLQWGSDLMDQYSNGQNQWR